MLHTTCKQLDNLTNLCFLQQFHCRKPVSLVPFQNFLIYALNISKMTTPTNLDKYRKLLKKTKEARVEQIILSGILPVFGNRIDGYRNLKRMAINGMVKRLCKEEDVGYVDLWDSFVGKEEMYVRDGLHLSGKGAAAFAEGLSGAVGSGLGKVRYLN